MSSFLVFVQTHTHMHADQLKTTSDSLNPQHSSHTDNNLNSLKHPHKFTVITLQCLAILEQCNTCSHRCTSSQADNLLLQQVTSNKL